MESTAETYQAAWLTVLDVTVIVVFGDADFDRKTPDERQQVYAALQLSLAQSNAGSDIVLVWQDAMGRMRFIASPRQQRFFGVMKFDQLLAQADRTVSLTPA